MAKHALDGLWYLFNDGRVSPVDPDKVQQSVTQDAYVLFYQKRRAVEEDESDDQSDDVV